MSRLAPGLSICVLLAACHDAPPPASPPPPAPSASAPAGYCRRVGGAAATPAPLSGTTGSALRPANTFSIVARDPVTGDLGVAVQSHWFSVGALVAWAEPGVGAVATQSFVEPAYGPKGLALLAGGAAPADALAKLLAADPASAARQVAFVDAQGRAAAHTGARCIQHAGHHAGNGYSVQANLMANDRVVPAMQRAFEAAKGDLAERMLAALDAAQAAGGDIRGCQSAAILVVGGQRTDAPWTARKLDLRVEDSPAPLAELRRLVTLARAYDHMNQGDLAVEKQDLVGAVEHYGAATKLVPGNAEMAFWQGVALAGHGRADAAAPLLRQAFADDPAWLELTRRLPAAGLLDAAIADQIVRDAAK
ncbi:MAG TPA: DUF1028 domain-containing protein [Kofleriaceae bacterium]|nr:DUF1028 domain-containing protein [Kofleriaceae bacterium]